MKSKEGYLLVDNRVAYGGKGLFEAAVYNCNHCQAAVVKHGFINPQCHVCSGCSKVICDACALRKSITLECIPFVRVMDEAVERAVQLQE